MKLVGLIAVNAAALRGLLRSESPPLGLILGVVVLLPLNVLVIGLIEVGRRLARTRECGPFLLGFQAAGWSITLPLASASAEFLAERSGWLMEYCELAFTPIIALLDLIGSLAWLQSHSDSWISLVLASLLYLIVLDVPLLVVAVLGGLIFRRFGITLVRRPRMAGTTSSPDVEPATSRP